MAAIHSRGITKMDEKDIITKVIEESKLAEKKYVEESKYAEAKYIEKIHQEQLAALKALLAKQLSNLDPTLPPSDRTQMALIQALKEQNFSAALELIEKKQAKMGPVERAVLDIALDSQKARSAGFSPESAKPDANAHKLHPMKEYGLVLGINAVGVDGTHSQYAHIGPTYQLMTDAVKAFSDVAPSPSSFKSIKDAFEFSNKTAEFSYSTSKNPKVGQALSDRILEGQITTIPISCRGHAMGLSVVPDAPPSKSGYMVFTNRGEGANPENHGTHIYRIDDLSKIDPAFINNMVNGHSAGASHADIMEQVQAVAGNHPPMHVIKQKTQKNDNCTVANTRANIHGIMLCQKAVQEGKPVEALSAGEQKEVKKQYKRFTDHMHTDKISKLTRALQNNPTDPDLRKLAQEYITQHPNSKESHKKTLQNALNSTAALQPSHVFTPELERRHAIAQEVGSKQVLSPTDKTENKKGRHR
jgi:hypothetical protein